MTETMIFTITNNVLLISNQSDKLRRPCRQDEVNNVIAVVRRSIFVNRGEQFVLRLF
jgi:hypothetical protein